MQGLFRTLGRAIRETGLALERSGRVLEGNYAFKEELSRHRRVMVLQDKKPHIGPDVFVAPSASVIGNVKIGKASSVWYGACLRGDVNTISVGSGVSIGDNAVVHVSGGNQKDGEAPTVIRDGASVGNGAIIHGCTLEANSTVEMGAIVFDRAVIEEGAVVGAGSMVPAGTRIPSGELWAGVPARFVRKLTPEERAASSAAAESTAQLAREHSAEHEKSSYERYVEETEDEYLNRELEGNKGASAFFR
eukprot:CAMPEP_0119131162 /NCGR_PEP_ID=MMETSP1310-20130426/9635_1 /TAXON_ID=464262 /ORGANISM="Genus nov. species nov., Strain RCC2339" /LENGTH=247 /DNA_ID=CAMNT_0007121715 /DNA_START=144 /DNA_END=887 /DNA_ORIENTATION=+